jgi:glycerol-3-phosphate dehydrogenase (NAD(P)+)
MSKQPDIAVIGAGAFGTALASVVARRGIPVSLLGRDAGRMADIQKQRTNDKALPDVTLPPPLQATADPACLASVATVLLAVPSQHMREAVRSYRSQFSADAALVICAKGIEQTSGLFLADVVQQEIDDRNIAVLSGPGFAADIARGLPTAMTLACTNGNCAESITAQLSGNTFRLYASTDVIGVEIGGALKNVLAIACGIVEGRGLGESARAALIARGLAELGRFSAAHGGRPETIAGLSGLGDLVLTATSHQSRNLRFGLALGKGAEPAALMAPDAPLSEGAFTATIAAKISRDKQIDMPITMSVARILDGTFAIDDAIDALMNRPLTTE